MKTETKSMRCPNCVDEIYMADAGDGDWECPVCGEQINEYAPNPYDDLLDSIRDEPALTPYRNEIALTVAQLRQLIDVWAGRLADCPAGGGGEVWLYSDGDGTVETWVNIAGTLPFAVKYQADGEFVEDEPDA